MNPGCHSKIRTGRLGKWTEFVPTSRNGVDSFYMPTVSVIVPCYNAADFLAATVESVLQQDLTDWELVLVDDGSRDGTLEIIRRSCSQDARIVSLEKANEGTTRARNDGFAKSNPNSKYVWFLDHDDQLAPDALRKMCAYLDEHPEVGLLGCQYEDVSAEGRRLGTGERSRWAPGLIMPHKMRDDEIATPFATFFCATGQGPYAMYRRSTYRQTEGWDTNFWPHEDTDMFCQMALLAEVHFLPDRFYWKRIHPTQGMSDAPRLHRGYAAFRAKWDNRAPKNAHEAKLLRDAKKYYYTVHRPFRDFKGAGIALGQFFENLRFAHLIWCGKLVVAAFRGMLGRHSKV